MISGCLLIFIENNSVFAIMYFTKIWIENMSKTDTNKLIKDLCLMQEQNPDSNLHLTLVVGGQLVTGRMITEEEFFSLEENIALKEYFIENIKKPRDKLLSNDEDVEFPSELKEWFLYLTDANFASGAIKIPQNGSVSMQIRVSDISIFTYNGID